MWLTFRPEWPIIMTLVALYQNIYLLYRDHED